MLIIISMHIIKIALTHLFYPKSIFRELTSGADIYNKLDDDLFDAFPKFLFEIYEILTFIG